MGGGSQHTRVGDLDIAYEVAGSGPPLLLLHGAFADSRSWRLQLEGLADTFTVVAWDAPGCGNSADAPAGWALSDYADAVARFVGALGLESPHVGGLSFGGALALELAVRHPGVPRSVVVASGYAGWAGSLSAEEVAARIDVFHTWMAMPRDEFIAQFSRQLFTGEVDGARAEESAAMMRDYRPDGMRVLTHALAGADLRDVLPRIAVPTLLLYGDADVRAPRPVAEALHAAIPGARLVMLEGLGHEHNVEAPERFNAEVRAFLLAAT